MKRSSVGGFQEFYQLIQTVHQIPYVDVLLGYTDIHGDLLPINNDDNYHKALSSANPLLRIIIQKRGKFKPWIPYLDMNFLTEERGQVYLMILLFQDSDCHARYNLGLHCDPRECWCPGTTELCVLNTYHSFLSVRGPGLFCTAGGCEWLVCTTTL